MKYKAINKYKIPFIVSLIVPLLISGPFLPDLIVSLSSLIFLVYIFIFKDMKFFKKTPVIIFFIFCAYCIFCSLLAEDIRLSFESSLFYFRIGLFACVIWFLIEQDRKILIYFYYIIIVSFSMLVLDGFFQFFFGKNIIGLPIITDRVSSFFGDELVMGSYLSRLFPLLFALFLLKKKKNMKFIM